MIIKSIEISNFKNIQSRTLYFDAYNDIPAINGWGKSNTVDAILWVLTDRLRNASADIKSIKTKITELDLSPKAKQVKVVLTTDVGVFEKTYNEVWKRARGSDVETLDSHETTYAIDGRPYKAKDYDTELALRLKMPLQFIPILMVANYFGVTLDYKDRRQIIKDLVPEVPFETVAKHLPTILRIKEVFEKEPRVEYLLKTNQQAIKALRLRETQLASEVNLLKSQIISKDEMSEKGSLLSQQLAAKNQLETLQPKFVASQTISPEQIQLTLSNLRLEHTIWSAIKDAKVNVVKCVSCGYTHQVDKVIENIVVRGTETKRLAEGKKTELKPTLEDIANRDGLLAKLSEIDAKLGKIYTSENATRDLEAKLKAEGDNKVELMKNEQVGDLLNMYFKKWVELFGDAANAQFSGTGITLRLFDYTLEGGIVEKCDILDNGVPYEKTNTASQIKLGVKLIDTIKAMKGYQDMPIIIDNAEAILEKDFTTSSQLIMFSAGKENN